jgi:hypothetical protein
MADSKNSGARLLDELAALDPPQRGQLANELRKVTETLSEVPDGRHAAHVLGLLAHLIDPS